MQALALEAARESMVLLQNDAGWCVPPLSLVNQPVLFRDGTGTCAIVDKKQAQWNLSNPDTLIWDRRQRPD